MILENNERSNLKTKRNFGVGAVIVENLPKLLKENNKKYCLIKQLISIIWNENTTVHISIWLSE